MDKETSSTKNKEIEAIAEQWLNLVIANITFKKIETTQDKNELHKDSK